MIVEPEQRVEDFAKAGADILSVHAEQSSTIHLHRVINQVKQELYFFAFKNGRETERERHRERQRERELHEVSLKCFCLFLLLFLSD